MRPITQANLDPSRDNSRHLQAEQEYCGTIGCFGLITLKTPSEPVCWTATDVITGGFRRLLTRSESGVGDIVSAVRSTYSLVSPIVLITVAI